MPHSVYKIVLDRSSIFRISLCYRSIQNIMPCHMHSTKQKILCMHFKYHAKSSFFSEINCRIRTWIYKKLHAYIYIHVNEKFYNLIHYKHIKVRNHFILLGMNKVNFSFHFLIVRNTDKGTVWLDSIRIMRMILMFDLIWIDYLVKVDWIRVALMIQFMLLFLCLYL